MTRNNEVVGLLPAAGYATRVSSLLPCSKEIYPITHSDGKSRVVSSYLLDSFKKAGVNQAYLVLRSGKWDIPEYYQDGSDIGMYLAHIIVGATEGVPHTIDKAYPFIKGKTVLLGFPDIIFKPFSAFTSLLEKQQATSADLVLGLFKVTNPGKADLVSFDKDGNVNDILIKPGQTDLSYSWITAVWTSVFSNFLHDYVSSRLIDYPEDQSELQISDIVRKAIRYGMKTEYVKFDNGSYLDIGTPEDLQKVNNPEWVRAFESELSPK